MRAKNNAEVAIRKASEKFVVFEDIQKDNSVKWEDENEFSYRGKMYDVAKEEIKNGRRIYLCYDDVAEACIYQKIDAVVNAQLGNEKDPSGNVVFHLMIMLSQVFIPVDKVSVIRNSFHEKMLVSVFSYFSHSSNCVLEIPLPPPRAMAYSLAISNL